MLIQGRILCEPPDWWMKSRSSRGNMHGLGGVGKIRLHKAPLEQTKSAKVFAPHNLDNATLGEDICSLIIGWTSDKTTDLVIVAVIEPRDIDPPCTGHISHVGVVTGNDNPASGFIVLENTDGLWNRIGILSLALTRRSIRKSRDQLRSARKQRAS